MLLVFLSVNLILADDCPEACPAVHQPLCAGLEDNENPNEWKQFENQCELAVYNCNNKDQGEYFYSCFFIEEKCLNSLAMQFFCYFSALSKNIRERNCVFYKYSIPLRYPPSWICIGLSSSRYVPYRSSILWICFYLFPNLFYSLKAYLMSNQTSSP